MQSVLTTRPENLKYANDGSLASVDAMLTKMAGVFYSRVLGMGLPMEFEDVLQELRMAYVKALQKWTPERAKFTTYCYTVARNEFNRRIERMVADREHLGMTSIDSLSSNADSEDVGDGYERYEDDDVADSPDQVIERRQALQAKLRSLSPHSRAIVLKLIANETDRQAPLMTMFEIASHLGMNRPAIKRARDELQEVFGVEVDFNALRKATPR